MTAKMRDFPEKAAEPKFKTLHTGTSTRRKLTEQMEIVRAKKEGKQNFFNDVIKFGSEKLFGLVIDGNMETLSANRKHRFHGIILQSE